MQLKTAMPRVRPNNIATANVQRLLLFIGLPKSVVYAVPIKTAFGVKYMGSRGFWHRYYGRYPFILHDAEICYRSLIRKCHPDVKDPSVSISATDVNQAWQRIVHLFEVHGCKRKND